MAETNDNKTIKFCEVCNTNVISRNYNRHTKTKKHQSNLNNGVAETKAEEKAEEKDAEIPKDLSGYCNVCNIYLKNKKSLQKHKKSKKHIANLQEEKQEAEEQKQEEPDLPDNVEVAWEAQTDCSKDCLRMRKAREAKSGIKTKPKPRREWLKIDGVLETTEQRSRRLHRERQKRHKENKRQNQKK